MGLRCGDGPWRGAETLQGSCGPVHAFRFMRAATDTHAVVVQFGDLREGVGHGSAGRGAGQSRSGEPSPTTTEGRLGGFALNPEP